MSTHLWSDLVTLIRMCMHWDKSHVSFSPQSWPAFSDFSHQDVLAMLCCGEIILCVACTHKQSKKNVQVGFVFQVFILEASQLKCETN